MKKTKILFGAMLLLGINGKAQDWLPSGTGVSTTTTGNCKVGGTFFNPGGLIDMDRTGMPDIYRAVLGHSPSEGLGLYSNSSLFNGAGIEMFSYIIPPPLPALPPARNGSLSYYTNGAFDNSYAHTFWNIIPGAGGVPTSFDRLMVLHRNRDMETFGALNVGGGKIDFNELPGADSYRSIAAHSGGQGMGLYANNAIADGASIEMFSLGAAGREGQINYFTAGTNNNDYAHVFWNHIPSLASNDRLMVLHKNRDMELFGALYVKGGLIDMAELPGADSYRGIIGHSAAQGLGMMANTSTSDGAGIELYGGNETLRGRPGRINYFSNGIGGSELRNADYGHVFYNCQGGPNNNPTYSQLVAITKNGKVIIGSDLMTPIPVSGADAMHPDGYNLYVSKGILTEKLKVANHSDGYNWSDFVFNEDYNLPSLCDVESYINSNKHLPEIPSAKEVARDGIDVASMDAKLLQKIEELTLYVIQQQKEINELKTQVKH